MGVTHLSGLQILPLTYSLDDIKAGNFFGFPQLTQVEIDSIPEANLRPGIVVYNTTYDVYMAYMENRWNNLNTSLTYKGEGQEIGSPLAIPYGPRSVIELPESGNSDPGSLYYDSENDIARIFIGGSWQDVASSTSNVFENITVTDTATIATLEVSGTSHLNNVDADGHITAGAFFGGAATLTGNLSVDTVFGGEVNVTLITGQTVEAGNEGIINNLRVGFATSFGGSTLIGNLSGLSGVPLAAAGAGATVDIEGSSISGILTLTTGTGPTSGNLVDVTLFNTLDYTAVFGVVITPANLPAALATGVFSAYSELALIGPAKFTIYIATGHILDASEIYKWNYHIISNRMLP